MAPETRPEGPGRAAGKGSFNEAGARWPRKLLRRCFQVNDGTPSMRPGQDGPGNLSSPG